jgi:hypothetical protein
LKINNFGEKNLKKIFEALSKYHTIQVYEWFAQIFFMLF